MNVVKKIVGHFSIAQKINFLFLNLFEKKQLQNEIETIKINQGLILGNLNCTFKKEEILEDIKKSEFKIFSQWGDDGIISFLVDYLEIKNKRFVEFGVENYTECNTKFLLLVKNWKGLIMDGSYKNMNSLRLSDFYWKYDIKAVDVFVTRENINLLLESNGFSGEIGLLHIDIDGNDYWIWKAVDVSNPIIVIVEYNSLFGYDNAWTIPYNPQFYRKQAHYSNLYYGTSLLSICDLATEKGYYFIGCNSNGNNAYFVRKDNIKDLKPLSPEEGYIESNFSESRNVKGDLTFLRAKDRLALLKGMQIYNSRKEEIEQI
jgi:hypothetical protein